MKEYLEAGKIINKRGLGGELKIESYCDTPEVFCDFEKIYLDANGKDERKIQSVKLYKDWVHIKIDGVSTAEDADRLRNRLIYANRNDICIDEDSIFIDDILGLDVIDADNGTVYGKLEEVFISKFSKYPKNNKA